MKKILFSAILIIFVCSQAFAYSVANGLMEFDIPAQLEIQDDWMAQLATTLTDSFIGPSSGEAFKLTLQQKGINDFSSSAYNEYCRIIISIEADDSDFFTNADFKAGFNSLSFSEKQEFFTMFKTLTEQGIVLKQWNQPTTSTIGNLFALKFSYTRASTTDEGDVYVEQYNIVSGIYTISITCSYRINDKSKFDPAIRQFLNSLKFNVPEVYVNDMYEINVPGTSTKFLWPERTVKWSLVAQDTSVKSYQTMYDGIQLKGYLLATSYFKLTTKLSSPMQSLYMQQLSGEVLPALRLKLSSFSFMLTENVITPSSLKISYTYSESGVPIVGHIYFRFIDDFTILSISGEYLSDIPEAKYEVNQIIQSMGF